MGDRRACTCQGASVKVRGQLLKSPFTKWSPGIKLSPPHLAVSTKDPLSNLVGSISKKFNQLYYKKENTTVSSKIF